MIRWVNWLCVNSYSSGSIMWTCRNRQNGNWMINYVFMHFYWFMLNFWVNYWVLVKNWFLERETCLSKSKLNQMTCLQLVLTSKLVRLEIGPLKPQFSIKIQFSKFVNFQWSMPFNLQLSLNHEIKCIQCIFESKLSLKAGLGQFGGILGRNS